MRYSPGRDVYFRHQHNVLFRAKMRPRSDMGIFLKVDFNETQSLGYNTAKRQACSDGMSIVAYKPQRQDAGISKMAYFMPSQHA